MRPKVERNYSPEAFRPKTPVRWSGSSVGGHFVL